MIGLTRLSRQHSNPEQRQRFKSMYCTACKAALPSTGRLPLVFLPYEAAFLLMMIESLSGETWPESRSSCTLLPIRSRKVRIPPDAVHRAVGSFVQVALALNHADAVEDRDRAISKFFLKSAGSGISKEPMIFILFQECRELLQQGDMPDKQTGEVYRRLFLYVAEKAALSPDVVDLVGRVGHALGRLTHLVDEIIDYRKDLARGREVKHQEALGNLTMDSMDQLVTQVHLLPLLHHQEEIEAALHGIGHKVHAALSRMTKSPSPALQGAV